MNIIETIKQFFRNLRNKPGNLLEDFSKKNEKEKNINQIISSDDDNIEQPQQEQTQQKQPNENLQEETKQQEQHPSDISDDDSSEQLQKEQPQQEQPQQKQPNKDLQEETKQQEQHPSDISDDDSSEQLQKEQLQKEQPQQEQPQQKQPNKDLQEETQQQAQQPSDISDDDSIEQPQQEENSNKENSENDDFFDKLNDNYDRKKNLENQIHKAINSEEQNLDNRIIENIIRKLIQEDPFEKTTGYQRIDKKQLARHISLDLPHKILDDKYAAEKKPISFYFDFSESNNNSIFMYAKILTKLMKKDILLYLGYNDLTCKRIQVKRDNTKKSDISHLLTLEENDINSVPLGYNVDIFQVPIKIEELVEIDKIKKIVIFSDYDAADSIVEASRKCEVIWLCTERNNRGSYFKDINEHPSNRYKLKDFKGVFIKLDSPKKILEYLNNYGRSEYERRNRKEQLEGDSR